MASVMSDFVQRGFDYAWKRDDTLTDAEVLALFDGNFRPSDFRHAEGITYSRAKSAFLKGYKTGHGVLRRLPRTSNPARSIRAQVRRLASGQIQLKIPLKRGENALRKAHQLAKALGRKVVSVARVGSVSKAKIRVRRKRTR
jgi:hypothetical protein